MPRPTPIPLQSELAYGPVRSRRLGRSLGVNLLPPGRKLCTFDCVYCQYDATPDAAPAGFPAPEQVWEAVEAALRRAPCDAITVAGNGEPTLHPELARIVDGLDWLRTTHAPLAELVLLTNGTRLGTAELRAALPRFDRAFFKLDAGDDVVMRAIDRPRGFSIARLEAGLRALKTPFWLQAMFVTGARDNATPDALERWLDLVEGLRPVGVHVTTIDRGTTVPGLLPVSAERLERLAARVCTRGVPAEAFPCPEEGRFEE